MKIIKNKLVMKNFKINLKNAVIQLIYNMIYSIL